MAEMAELAVFGCLEKYLFTLFCFEIRKAQKSHCESVPLHLVAVKAAFFPYLPGFIVPKEVVKVCGELIKKFWFKGAIFHNFLFKTSVFPDY